MQSSAHSHTHATWLEGGLNRGGGGRGINKHIFLYSLRYNEIARSEQLGYSVTSLALKNADIDTDILTWIT